MLSKYFKLKTKTENFIKNTEEIISELKEKKILACGDYEQFYEINKKFNLNRYHNIIAFAPINRCKKTKSIENLPIANIENLQTQKFDLILICDEYPEFVHEMLLKYLTGRIPVKYLFNELLDERENIKFVINNNFEKTIQNFGKKFKDKKVLFYGAGSVFSLINEFYDLTPINAIGIADKKADVYDTQQYICNYKLISPSDMLKINPDYVLVTAKAFPYIAKELYNYYFKNTKTKILPLVKRNIISVILNG